MAPFLGTPPRTPRTQIRPQAHALALAEALRAPQRGPADAERVGFDPLLRAQLATMGESVEGLLRRCDEPRFKPTGLESPRAPARLGEGEHHPSHHPNSAPLLPIGNGPAHRQRSSLLAALSGSGSGPGCPVQQSYLEAHIPMGAPGVPRLRSPDAATGSRSPPDTRLLERLLRGLESEELTVNDALNTLDGELRSPEAPMSCTGFAGSGRNSPEAPLSPLRGGAGGFAGSGQASPGAHPLAANSRAWDSPPQGTNLQSSCSRCSVLSLQVRALAQSLAGFSARAFNWSVGLSASQRRALAELALEYMKPCAHIDAHLSGLCAELEKARWDDAAARSSGKDSRSFTEDTGDAGAAPYDGDLRETLGDDRLKGRASGTWNWWNAQPEKYALAIEPIEPTIPFAANQMVASPQVWHSLATTAVPVAKSRAARPLSPASPGSGKTPARKVVPRAKRSVPRPVPSVGAPALRTKQGTLPAGGPAGGPAGRQPPKETEVFRQPPRRTSCKFFFEDSALVSALESDTIWSDSSGISEEDTSSESLRPS